MLPPGNTNEKSNSAFYQITLLHAPFLSLLLLFITITKIYMMTLLYLWAFHQ